MNIQNEFRKAQQRLGEREENSRKLYERLRREDALAMDPIFRALEQIKCDRYLISTGKDSKQPFDFVYNPDLGWIEFQGFLPEGVPPGFTQRYEGQYRFEIHRRSDGYELNVKPLGDGYDHPPFQNCLDAKQFIRRFIEFAIASCLLSPH
jgi:hypothetical protein